jgi:hypothetical protein
MALDDLERRVHQVRPRELRRGNCSRAMVRGLEYIKAAASIGGYQGGPAGGVGRSGGGAPSTP